MGSRLKGVLRCLCLAGGVGQDRVPLGSQGLSECSGCRVGCEASDGFVHGLRVLTAPRIVEPRIRAGLAAVFESLHARVLEHVPRRLDEARNNVTDAAARRDHVAEARGVDDPGADFRRTGFASDGVRDNLFDEVAAAPAGYSAEEVSQRPEAHHRALRGDATSQRAENVGNGLARGNGVRVAIGDHLAAEASARARPTRDGEFFGCKAGRVDGGALDHVADRAAHRASALHAHLSCGEQRAASRNERRADLVGRAPRNPQVRVVSGGVARDFTVEDRSDKFFREVQYPAAVLHRVAGGGCQVVEVLPAADRGDGLLGILASHQAIGLVGH